MRNHQLVAENEIGISFVLKDRMVIILNDISQSPKSLLLNALYELYDAPEELFQYQNWDGLADLLSDMHWLPQTTFVTVWEGSDEELGQAAWVFKDILAHRKHL